uniref:Uncharacterized protein n=1 Tax=Cucumis sativus TaxID=3659 RepID=A0A0A0KXU9_CUCSA
MQLLALKLLVARTTFSKVRETPISVKTVTSFLIDPRTLDLEFHFRVYRNRIIKAIRTETMAEAEVMDAISMELKLPPPLVWGATPDGEAAKPLGSPTEPCISDEGTAKEYIWHGRR